MEKMKRHAAILFLGLMTAAASAQIGERSSHSLIESDEPQAQKGSVSYLYPEQISAPAGKTASVALHFRVEPGMHINSHTPKDEFLIPTVFSVPEGSGVKLEGVTYPEGSWTTLPMAPKEKLSVYTGEFVLLAKLVAQPGDHLVKATLRYQACDNNACMPPRTLIVAIDVKGTKGRDSGTRD
jgi:hypothetical protein